MAANLPLDPYVSLRLNMVDHQLRRRSIKDTQVLRAMSQVPRHRFVPVESRDQAYEDYPLPIGEGQTLSQPYIVASMLSSLAIAPSSTVLEIGTGSGYQTALLAEMAQQVYSVERLPSLAQSAELILNDLGYNNVKIVVADGSEGLPQFAPYDATIVSAAAPRIPPALLEQLGEGGRMIIPVGPSQAQELKLVQKREGRIEIQTLEACRFVPLIGTQGYDVP